MVKRMLIDATHPEETRVVVVSGNRLEEFDFETSSKKQLKGNIYLAKVTRVEPSLQAAFVDYGGNRHGFLAFSEIHPDYYRIPVSDRDALMAETARLAEGEAAGGEGSEGVETLGGDGLGGDEIDDIGRRHKDISRNYKIQEVISRRQILLVQVTKEERGNKGAALTTYISLAGRYVVLMPNTPRGGGISRKITNTTDRRRLKSILEDLEIPEGMAVILRTAGMERPKTEIKRDYEYLMRLWDTIRETTLKSTAPALVHEEANLIKRSVRDLYSRDIDEIHVEGEEGYRFAKDFMKMLMPSHAKKVKLYKEEMMPLFQRFQVESQIDNFHDPVVQLKSGGYIVINPTEALVSIDVNSGRSTRERNIEETATRTNLEAAEEIARQLRLRDLAGLIVIDFIDMEETRNQSHVEKRLKEAMRSDRARIQIGRISPFGLLEMSRQRLRPSLMETTMKSCPHCGGTGYIRSTESTALHILRAIEEEGLRRRSREIRVFVPTAEAMYVLNQKRNTLIEIEKRHGLKVTLASDDTLIPPNMRVERIAARAEGEGEAPRPAVTPPEMPAEAAVEAEGEAEAEAETTVAAERAERPEGAPGEGRGRRRRGRRRRGRGGEPQAEAPMRAAEPGLEPAVEAAEGEAAPMAGEAPAPGAGGEPGREGRRSRRRGRRGGRRRSKRQDRPGFEGGPGAPAPQELAGSATEAEAAAGEGAYQPSEPYELSDMARGHEPMPAESGRGPEPQGDGPAENGADRAPHGGREPAGHEAGHEAERTDAGAAPASGNGGFAQPTEPEAQPTAAPGGEAADKDTARKGWLSRFLD
jgi:ribonuclease E